jgi:hypothetical protein
MAQDYRVVGQRQVMNINPSGTGFTNDWEVTYTVTDGPSKGTTSTVTIPSTDHNAQYVDDAIREQIGNLHGVASLGSAS